MTQQQQKQLGSTEKALPAVANQQQEPKLKGERSARRPWFDAMTAVARRKLNAPPEWEWYAARVLQPTDDSLVEGGIPNRRNDGRKRSGYARWEGVVGQQVVVTRDEIAAARAEYERDTGKCAECAGCGETLAGSHYIHGHRYRTCRRCDGSGRATEAVAGSVVLAFDPAERSEADSRSTPAPAVAVPAAAHP